MFSRLCFVEHCVSFSLCLSTRIDLHEPFSSRHTSFDIWDKSTSEPITHLYNVEKQYIHEHMSKPMACPLLVIKWLSSGSDRVRNSMCCDIANESAHVPTGTSRRASRRVVTGHRAQSRALDDVFMVLVTQSDDVTRFFSNCHTFHAKRCSSVPTPRSLRQWLPHADALHRCVGEKLGVQLRVLLCSFALLFTWNGIQRCPQRMDTKWQSKRALYKTVMLLTRWFDCHRTSLSTKEASGGNAPSPDLRGPSTKPQTRARRLSNSFTFCSSYCHPLVADSAWLSTSSTTSASILERLPPVGFFVRGLLWTVLRFWRPPLLFVCRDLRCRSRRHPMLCWMESFQPLKESSAPC